MFEEAIDKKRVLERPTTDLRQVSRGEHLFLQQKWELIHLGPMGTRVEYEWRYVPVVDEEEAK